MEDISFVFVYLFLQKDFILLFSNLQKTYTKNPPTSFNDTYKHTKQIQNSRLHQN